MAYFEQLLLTNFFHSFQPQRILLVNSRFCSRQKAVKNDSIFCVLIMKWFLIEVAISRGQCSIKLPRINEILCCSCNVIVIPPSVFYVGHFLLFVSRNWLLLTHRFTVQYTLIFCLYSKAIQSEKLPITMHEIYPFETMGPV